MPNNGHLTLFSRTSGLVRCYSCLVWFWEFRYMLVWMHYMTSYRTILKAIPFGKILIDWWRCKTIVRVGMSGKEADVNIAVKQLTGHGNRKWLPGSGKMRGKERNKDLSRTRDKESRDITKRLKQKDCKKIWRQKKCKWLRGDYPEISHSELVRGMEEPKKQLGLLVKRWQKFRLGHNFENLWKETHM